MATPKKKISKSRRNMRRFAAGNKLDKPTVIVSPVNSEVTRPHRITREMLASGRYLETTASFKRRSAQKSS